MRAGRWRAALAGIAIAIAAGIFLFGLWEIRALVVHWWMAISQARTRG
jgi:hypothetical protein